MQIPKRRGERNNQKKIDPHMTKEKAEELKKKLAILEKKVFKLAVNVKNLASDGDFSENAGYQSAKHKLRSTNYSILKIKDYLKYSIIIEKNKNTDRVELGSNVEIEIMKNKKHFIYKILGSLETNPEKGIISQNSPLGSAILGKKINEEFIVNINNKEKKYKIINIF
jgi:transcription elongation factor GreA